MPHKKNDKPQASACDPTASSGCCGGGLPRRDFLKMVGGGSLALLAAQWPVMAGPFEGADFEKLIPADKKLRPEWIQSLYARGTPTVYRGAELEKIGMPIGGICTGQLYLGGDGRLWHWDIFNLPPAGNFTSTNGPNYAHPPLPQSPIEQGFAIRIGDKTRTLDSRGFADIRFRGQYPMAFVDYRADDCPVTVALEAFTPYIPLNVADSSLPATVMRFVVKNTSQAPVEVELTGSLENAVCLRSGQPGAGQRRNRISRETGLTLLHCTAEPSAPAKAAAAPVAAPAQRPDIVFEDFEKGYERWTVEGVAFGRRPAQGALEGQQAVSGFKGKGLVNSYLGGDSATGQLTSQPFKIERRYIAFLVGGGKRQGKTGIQLIVNGQPVRHAAGRDSERLETGSWNVADLQGQEARLKIVDAATGQWGHVNVDQIVFTDTPPANGAPGPDAPLDAQDDYGSLGLALLGAVAERASPDATAPFGEKLVGELGRKATLAPGAEAEVTFVLTWFFPTVMGAQRSLPERRRSYANRFDSAGAVARYVATHFERLAGQTRQWNRTWYDSTLPYWFLDRAFASISTLATSTCFQFVSGRFYAFEGVYCCAGTCQHVWNYAQSVGRIFPELERDLRQRTDFGTAWHDSGAIDYRGQYGRQVAHDGQCGVILRAYREHQTAANDAYLRACWPRIKKSIEFLIAEDGNDNGILEGTQYNTLDAAWFGPMAWISSMYIGALRAGEAMAVEMGDAAFAQRCRTIAGRGSEHLVKDLFNGEYFIHKPDPKHPEATNSNVGCHIDQCMGDALARPLGLPRVFPVKEARSALESLWKYNFTPDAGGYMKAMQQSVKGGRWYAMAGEAGVIMTSWPHGGAEHSSRKGHFAYYFNEVWTGQEHQLAALMLWEGLIEKGLAVVRAVHDRHHAALRNPYNEVECSDHYSRAMSSYGAFQAACGFEYHGPQGHIGFAPRLTPENFKAPFTAAEGWGTYSQKVESGKLNAELAVKWGQLRVQTIALASARAPATVRASLDGQPLPCRHESKDGRVVVVLEKSVVVPENKTLMIVLA